jgi:cysteine desulfuration protein SufE
MDANELVARFAFFDDWQERYRYIIDLGMKLPNLDEKHKTEDNKVRGCMSQVWMVHEVEDTTLHFYADSDSHIVKGLISVLLSLYSGHSAGDVLALDIENVFESIGLNQHLSPNRRNGFYAMVERIRSVATANQ